MSTTILKILALIFMFIDHVGEFVPIVPIWFRWIGRISAPIFFFCMAWGFYYTKSRKKYLLRMYLFGLGMAILNLVFNSFCRNSYYISIDNNIFVTMFVSCVIIFIIDTLFMNPIKGKRYLKQFILLQLFSTTLIVIIDFYGNGMIPYQFFSAILGNIFLNEGGISFVILGILFYYTKDNNKKLAISYSVFCLLYSYLYFTNTIARILLKLNNILPHDMYMIINAFFSILGINTKPIYHIRFYELTSYNWMIIFAMPFILLYNGNKGKGYKYFFYLFYPVHIYILYLIGNYLL